MPLTITDFKKPDRHPYGMLDGQVTNACENETLLTWLLTQSLTAGEFGPIRCRYRHPGLVAKGYLVEHGEPGKTCDYSLSNKSLGLLYGYFAAVNAEKGGAN